MTELALGLSLDPLLVLIAAAWTAALLLPAAAAKLGDRGLFHQHLAAYRVPEALQPALVWALPLAEGMAALGLVTPWRAASAGLAAALLGLYAAAMAWHLVQGRVLDCGCGGAPLPLSAPLVARNLVLAVVALAAGLSSTARPVGVADMAVAAAALLLGALLYAAFSQVLRQAQRPSSTMTTSGRSPA
jgi:hypothetical protein